MFLRLGGGSDLERRGALTHHHDGALHALHLDRTFTRELRDSPGLDSSSAVWRRQLICPLRCAEIALFKQIGSQRVSIGSTNHEWEVRRRLAILISWPAH